MNFNCKQEDEKEQTAEASGDAEYETEEVVVNLLAASTSRPS